MDPTSPCGNNSTSIYERMLQQIEPTKAIAQIWQPLGTVPCDDCSSEVNRGFFYGLSFQFLRATSYLASNLRFLFYKVNNNREVLTQLVCLPHFPFKFSQEIIIM